MSSLIEDMSFTPSPTTIEHHLAQYDQQQHPWTPPSAPDTNSDVPDSASDAASVMSGETAIGEPDAKPDPDSEKRGADADTKPEPEPVQTTIALAPHNLTAHDLRSSRMAATMHNLFAIDKPVHLSPLSEDFDAPDDDAQSLKLSAHDLRKSRIGKKLDGVFGLSKHAHFAETPAEVVTFAYAPSLSGSEVTLDEKDGELGPRSAFSLSPTTPRPRRTSSYVDPDLVPWSVADEENPQAWSAMYKWTLTAVIGFMTLNACVA
jgi:hypothetical protein